MCCSGRDVLAAKENERVIEKFLVYRAERRLVHRPGQVDALDLRAQDVG